MKIIFFTLVYIYSSFASADCGIPYDQRRDHKVFDTKTVKSSQNESIIFLFSTKDSKFFSHRLYSTLSIVQVKKDQSVNYHHVCYVSLNRPEISYDQHLTIEIKDTVPCPIYDKKCIMKKEIKTLLKWNGKRFENLSAQASL